MIAHHELTAQSLLRRACEKHADRPVATLDGETWTYRETWQRGGELARVLVDHGLQRGDFVGVLMSNCHEYLVANFACVRGGFVNIPMNDMLVTREIEYLFADSGARAAVVGDGFIEMVADLAPDLPALELVLAVDDSPPEGQASLADALDSVNGRTHDVIVGPDDPLRLCYTGGTTGKPKGAHHTHGTLAMNMLAHVVALDIRDAEEMLLMTPLPHAAGYIHLAGLTQGAHLTLTRGFDPEALLHIVEAEPITWTFLVPTMIYRTLDHPDLDSTDTSGLDTVLYGAAPITPERLAEALDALGPVFVQVYGQTEMPDIGMVLPKSDHVVGEPQVNACGKPATMVDAGIADPDVADHVEFLPRGEVGELVMRSPYVMEGYHGKPEQTAETLVDGPVSESAARRAVTTGDDVDSGDSDSGLGAATDERATWLRTGDIARMDEAGYVYLLDRSKDVVVSGGMNVYTIEVEDALDEHPDVRQVAVVGVPDDDWGEAVHAVVCRDDPELDEDDLQVFASDRLSTYKRPKSVAFVDELPTTPYGKVDKKALREPYWEGEERNVN